MYVEQVEDAETVDEMRAEIFRLRHYDHIVRNIMDAADYSGMSAEDRYVTLAYFALKEANSSKEKLIDQAMLRPATPFVIKSSEKS